MSGTYSVNATITGGCASIDGTTTVTVNPSIPASVNITANPSGAICSGTAVTFTATPTNGGTTPAYQWQLNGNNISDTNPTHTTTTLANGDVITCVMTSDAACITGSPVDTSNAITVTVNPKPVKTTSLSGYTIKSNQTGATYQWLICPAMTHITGAINQSYTATADGDYAVIVTLGGCSDTSACVSIIITGIGKIAADNQFTISPNPATSEIQVIGNQSTVIGIEVYNMLGERVYTSPITDNRSPITVNVADFPRGVYMVEVRTEKGVAVSKFIKE
jgi:hypothetical protein